MGQTLSEPVTSKETSSCQNNFVKVGSSCMQGWRITMEDAHIHLLSLPNDKDTCFFGVFDGHGGSKVAQYAGEHLYKKVITRPEYSEGRIADALKYGFLDLDEEMLKDNDMKDELAGTTANVVLLKGNRIFCGNVGDSRCVASVRGQVEQLSFDHKPGNETETKRIISAGGWVEFNRVNVVGSSSLYLFNFSGEYGLVGSHTEEAYSIAGLIKLEYAAAFADGVHCPSWWVVGLLRQIKGSRKSKKVKLIKKFSPIKVTACVL
eukprot:XP_011420984.1 PREDICTED: probable protein phosphatase 2C T23F11.1 [Crassostrea gigas]